MKVKKKNNNQSTDAATYIYTCNIKIKQNLPVKQTKIV